MLLQITHRGAVSISALANIRQLVNMTDAKKILVFTARRSYASAVLGVVILSVCPSVCLSVTRVLCD